MISLLVQKVGEGITNALESQFQNGEKLNEQNGYEIRFRTVLVDKNLGQKDTVFYIYEYLRQDGSLLNEIKRRYSHFVWFQEELQSEFFGRIIPSLPEKVTDPDINKRKIELLYFLQKIINHPQFSKSRATQEFLKQQRLDELQKFIERSASFNSKKGLMQNIWDYGYFAFQWAGDKVNKNPVPIPPRAKDDYDLEFDKYESDTQNDKKIVKLVYSDILNMVDKLTQQTVSLRPNHNIFCFLFFQDPDFQTDRRVSKVESIYQTYNSKIYILKEQCLIQLEGCTKDYDRVIGIVQEYFKLKDKIHTDTNLRNNDQYSMSFIRLLVQTGGCNKYQSNIL
ncbi:hypothetical protein pb186bvf_011116 [Paramecium bursaria]